MAKDKDFQKENGVSQNDGSVQGQAISQLLDEVENLKIKYENLESEYVRLVDQVQACMDRRPKFDPDSIRLAVIQGAVIAAIHECGLATLERSPSSIDQYILWTEHLVLMVLNRLNGPQVIPDAIDKPKEMLNPVV